MRAELQRPRAVAGRRHRAADQNQLSRERRRRCDAGQFTEEGKAAAFRLEHARQLHRQTKALQSIKNYVAIWFWYSVAAAVFFIVSPMMAASSGY
ncbi:hypothetical protein [Geodermatophilus sp. URMC 64]